jgi:hypothetical protein
MWARVLRVLRDEATNEMWDEVLRIRAELERFESIHTNRQA